MAEYLNYLLFAFTSIFTIVNPFGVMPVFLGATAGMDRVDAKKVAQKAVITAILIMLGFSLSGRLIFNFFSISVDALRIVGGILFFMVGYDMIQGKAARTKQLAEKNYDIDELAISPLAIPTICGPGAITVTTVLAQETEGNIQKILFIVAIASVGLITFLFLLGASKIMGAIGKNGNRVFFRLMGLIIMMVAIEFFFKGLKPYVQNLIQPDQVAFATTQLKNLPFIQPW